MVAGVDFDLDAVRKARVAIGDGPDAVFVSDGCGLPFEDESFDIITSFETLEHLDDRMQFLSELQRVLTPTGLCMLSTPNANYTLPVNGKPHNPHHVYEYTPEELLAELQKQFSCIELFGQTLDPRFMISPFWEDQQKQSRTLIAQCRWLLWRVLNKLPMCSRDWMSQLLWGHDFIPGEMDYQFQPDTYEMAPVLVALCRRRSE